MAIQESIPNEKKELLLRKITDLILNESSIGLQAKQDVTDKLLFYRNNLEECQKLKKTGDYYRKEGPSGKSIDYYEKILKDINM